MRDRCRVVIFLMFLFLFSVPAFAANTETYYIDTAGISIDIPSDFETVVRGSDGDDSSTYGADKADLLAAMKAQNIYLETWDKDHNFVITLGIIDNVAGDFNLVEDSTVESIYNGSIKKMFSENGVVVVDWQIYHHNQAKFIKIRTSQYYNDVPVDMLTYYTVRNNQSITIQLYTYTNVNDRESVLQNIVDSIEFDSNTAIETGPTKEIQTTEAFLYADKDGAVEFAVPENWTQTELDENSVLLDAKFSSNFDSGVSIMYASEDIWSDLSENEKRGLSRSDANMSVLNSGIIADGLKIDANTVSKKTYNDVDYYVYSLEDSTSAYGLTFGVIATCAITVRNGYAYVFAIDEDQSGKYYTDFEKLLSSVRYSPIPDTEESKNTGIDKNLLTGIAIGVLICAIGLGIYRFASAHIQKQKQQQGVNDTADTVPLEKANKVIDNGQFLKQRESNCTSEEVDSKETNISDKVGKIVYCYRCGEKLDAENTFCHKCGAKIIKDNT